MNQKIKQPKPSTPAQATNGIKPLSHSLKHKKVSNDSTQRVNPTTETNKAVCKYPLKAFDISSNWQKLQRELKNNKNQKDKIKNSKIKTSLKKNGAVTIENKKQLNGIANNNKTKANVTKKPQNNNQQNGTKKQSNGGFNNKKNTVPVAKQSNETITTVEKEIWFDNVDECLIRSSLLSSSTNVAEKKLCKESSFKGLTRFVAMDCEMVGAGYNATTSILARVSIVNLYGHCVYDKFVKPTEEVTDYRTEVSGIRPENLVNAEDFKVVQKEVFEIIRNRILVGHAIHHDLKVLYLSKPKHMIRDTSHYFKCFFNNRTPALKKLTEVYLGVKIQHGEHDSITDAQATMRLYTLFKKKWESSLSKKPRRSQAKEEQKPAILPTML